MSPKSLLADALWYAVRVTGRKFVFVIDGWDAPYHLAQDDKVAQDASSAIRCARRSRLSLNEADERQ